MSSSPHIFDQEVVAGPCRAGCRRHIHAEDLPGAYTNHDQMDIGGNVPTGWTPQPRPWQAPATDDLMWFMCNVCEELVSELDVEGHRCEQ